MSILQQWCNDVLHLVFPHNCIGCGSDVLDDEQQLCLRCLTSLPATNFFKQPGNPVEASFFGRLPLQHAAAGYFFTKQSLMQHLVTQFKYKGNRDIGVYLGNKLGNLIAASGRFNQVDVLVPLPLNPRREKKRGYNQATALCKGIAEVWDKPVIDNVVVRKVYTETQTHMGRINRWQNMDGVFAINDEDMLINKHVLLVDDVITTGATLEACGAEILKLKDTSLSIATLAYTLL